MSYQNFIKNKLVLHEPVGFSPSALPESLFDFQAAIVNWAVRRARAAIFSDPGTGKSLMQLSWADQIARHTGKPVLILTRSEEHTSELQSHHDLVCRLLLEK